MFLESEKYYHVYNRANGFEKIFANEENYDFFLRKYQLHISPFVKTFCYCLMPNHFHFAIQVKEEKHVIDALRVTLPEFKTLEGLREAKPAVRKIARKLLEFEKLVLEKNPSWHDYLEKWLSKQFSDFFNSYTQAFNNQQGRMGSLFMKNFKRKHIHDENYFRNLIHYIHMNPIEAGICYKLRDWKYSSYHHILKSSSPILDTMEILWWFDSLENFVQFHNRVPTLGEETI